MKRKTPLIHNKDGLFKIIIASLFAFWLKNGIVFIAVMFICFFISEHFAKKEYNNVKKKIRNKDYRRY